MIQRKELIEILEQEDGAIRKTKVAVPDLDAEKKDIVKAQKEAEITAAYPDYKQLNIMRQAILTGDLAALTAMDTFIKGVTNA